MSQITILLLYLLAAVAFTMCRLPRFGTHSRALFIIACIFTATGIGVHAETLLNLVLPGHGFHLTIGDAVSLIGLELAVVGLFAALVPALRGISGGLVFLAAFTALLTDSSGTATQGVAIAWQVRAHILIALLSYGALTVGTIVALFALAQERRLRAAKLSPVNQLFAPLETTEKLLFALAATGFAGLTLAIATGTSFVTDLVEQHLAHKFALSLIAWLVFGILLAGRFWKGWRGKRAVRMYLGGFAILCLAYFGSRLILEEVFHRSWS